MHCSAQKWALIVVFLLLIRKNWMNIASIVSSCSLAGPCGKIFPSSGIIFREGRRSTTAPGSDSPRALTSRTANKPKREQTSGGDQDDTLDRSKEPDAG